MIKICLSISSSYRYFVKNGKVRLGFAYGHNSQLTHLKSTMKSIDEGNSNIKDNNDAKINFLTSTIPTNISTEDLSSLVHFIQSKKNIVCITGAGVSTSSGIPDYRGPQGSYNKGHKPVVHDVFMKDENSRKRYWGRSLYGYEKFAFANPNYCHIALSLLQKYGHISLIVTQNVDRLHQRVGSKLVVDLHGRGDQVKCMSCNHQVPREIMQETLKRNNQHFLKYIQELNISNDAMRADGDTELGAVDYNSLDIPSCPVCNGVLKTNVTFFGDNVPLSIVENVYANIANSDGILVIGTSLEVFSAYRFVDRANSLNIPIAIINAGETRAERKKLPNIVLKIHGECAAIMKLVVARVIPRTL